MGTFTLADERARVLLWSARGPGASFKKTQTRGIIYGEAESTVEHSRCQEKI